LGAAAFGCLRHLAKERRQHHHGLEAPEERQNDLLHTQDPARKAGEVRKVASQRVEAEGLEKSSKKIVRLVWRLICAAHAWFPGSLNPVTTFLRPHWPR